MDGHLPPAPIIWVRNYQRYFRDLVDITREVRMQVDEATIQLELPPGADGVAMTERMFQRTSEIVVDRLRATYGDWGAFEAWAPQNVTRALIYLITGE